MNADGYTVLRQAVPQEKVRAALRMILMRIRHQGLTVAEIEQGTLSGFFPDLRQRDEILDLYPNGADWFCRWAPRDALADPQILLRFPDEQQPWTLQPHRDTLPDWASPGSRYRAIIGVALTDCGRYDGALHVWPGSHGYHCYCTDKTNCRGPLGEAIPVPLAAGDAVVMHPDLGHSGSLNLGHTIRAAVYFRVLTGGAS